jgi:hypothetical protein
VKELKLEFHGKMREFKEILLLCPNLKDLELQELRICKGNPIDFEEPLPQYKLDYFTIKSYDEVCLPKKLNCKLFEIFRKCSAKTIERQYSSNDFNMDNFKDFLLLQRDLEVLTVSHLDDFENTFFDDEKLLKVPFRLKKFSCFEKIVNENFPQFLNLHKDTMTNLSLLCAITADCGMILNEFRSLEALSFSRYPAESYTKTDKIKLLGVRGFSSVDVRNMCDLPTRFPFVENLQILYGTISEYSNMHQFKHLKILILNNVNIEGKLIVPNCEEIALNFCAIKHIPDCPYHNFAIVSDKLREVVLNQTTSIEWLVSFLDRPEFQLQKLTITSTFISPVVNEAIDRNSTKIQKLNVKMKKCRYYKCFQSFFKSICRN